MDSSLTPDPASGETPPDLGQPSPGVIGGTADDASSPEHAPDATAAQPWAALPPPPVAAGWGVPPVGPAAWPQPQWGMPQATAPSPRRRAAGLAFGGALLIGGLAGAVIMAEVGNLNNRPAASSTSDLVPTQPQAPSGGGGFLGGGGFSGQNPFSGGTGSTGSSSGTNGLDAASIAAKVDPAVVDITSHLADGTAEGTGTVLTSGGQVLTNNHVIQGATLITAQINGTGRMYAVSVVGADPADDVALLQLQGASNLKTITVGDSSNVAAGDPILAIGNAMGLGGTPAVAAGNVVQTGQTITATDDTGANPETLNNLIQVDANVQPGDSGGPLVDASGKVVGMDTAASSSGRGFRFRGVTAQGFAIPIDAAMTIVQQLRNGGGAPQTAAQTAFLGVDIGPSSTQTTSGADVVGVEPGTPAASVGLAQGDVITNLGGRSITSPDALSSAVKASKPGDHVKVTWVDSTGQQHTATVQLAGLSAPAA